jgi:adenylate cyclase
MNVSALIKDLIVTVSDSRDMGFDYVQTKEVPSAYKIDSNLTYKSGAAKKGKIIKTCVLYVDIRDSVKLVDKHQFDTMGKIYNAFAKSILKIADSYDAKVRNIIGDRIMVVFPSENCFTKAVHCAITINHISGEINRIFKHVNFKCGIGIDYGEMRVIKVGTEKKGDENANYKNLIWVGHPANKASRLTDVANKEIEETFFEVKIIRKYKLQGSERWFESPKIVEYTAEEFADFLLHANSNTIWLEKSFDSFVKKKKTKIYSPILISTKVYDGYKTANPKENDILNDCWKVQPKGINNITEDVYGSGLTWEL